MSCNITWLMQCWLHLQSILWAAANVTADCALYRFVANASTKWVSAASNPQYQSRQVPIKLPIWNLQVWLVCCSKWTRQFLQYMWKWRYRGRTSCWLKVSSKCNFVTDLLFNPRTFHGTGPNPVMGQERNQSRTYSHSIWTDYLNNRMLCVNVNHSSGQMLSGYDCTWYLCELDWCLWTGAMKSSRIKK